MGTARARRGRAKTNATRVVNMLERAFEGEWRAWFDVSVGGKKGMRVKTTKARFIYPQRMGGRIGIVNL